jgi:cobalt-zinc-cadmium efflux system outer membrane protein
MKRLQPLPFTAVAAVLLAAGAAEAQGPPAQTAPAPAPLTYRAALQLATERNLGLAAARLQRPIREAGVRIAGQRPNPDVSFEATQDVPHYAVTMNLPVEVAGQRGRRLDVARAELALADVDLRAALTTLRKNVRLAFYGLVAADERTKVAEAVLAVADRVRQVAQARFEEGAAPRLEVMQADLGVARAKADLELTRSERVSVQAQLNALLNQPSGQVIAVAAEPAEATPIPAIDRALAMASASNVDLASLERQATVEEQRVRLLRAERLPTPSLMFGGIFDAPGELSAGVSGGVSLGVPLFSRNQGEIAQSQATASQLRAERDAMRREIEGQVFGMVARVNALAGQAEVYRASLVPTATSLEALAEESYRLGRTSVLEVLDAQRSLRDVQREYVQALQDYQAAIADLEEVIGAPIDQQ